jgi:Signal transduction histidine kinase
MNKSNNKNRIKLPSLWAAFAAFGFFTILISSTILVVIIVFMSNSGFINGKIVGKPLMSLLMLLIISIMIASSISFLVGRRVFKPITAISSAMTDVAKGNFSVKLDYGGRVDELGEMSANFNAMVHELSTIETLRSDFVVMVSHEFKTPLASIEGYATILQNSELTREEIQDCALKITESTKQLANLSSNILMISHLENKEIITEKTEYRLDEQIRQAVLLLEPLWENKKLDLNIELDPAVYFGSEELLMQVWINLIGNAIKFTPRNGEISILLKKSPRTLSIFISDTGIGMSPDEQKHIFDKFYQADRSGRTDGNGLGLSLVKRIIDLSRGSITIQSEANVGSSFIVNLPIFR